MAAAFAFGDSAAATEALASVGLDPEAIRAQAMALRLESIGRFEALISAAEKRRDRACGSCRIAAGGARRAMAGPSARRRGGPVTAAGKARAAQNARAHGLASSAELFSAHAPEIARLAAALAGPRASPERLSLCRTLATAEVDLRRIRRQRRAIFERPPPAPATGELIRAWSRFEAGRAAAARLVDPEEAGPAALLDAASLRELFGLERYERRAYARRLAALRAVDALEVAEAAAARASADAGDERGSPIAALAPGLASAPASAAKLAERTPGAPGVGPGPQPTRGGGANAGVASGGSGPEPPACGARHDLRATVARLAFAGLSEMAIAGVVGVPLDELRAGCGHELAHGAEATIGRLACALAAKAEDGDTQAAIFLLKARADWRTSGPFRQGSQPAAMEVEERRQLVDDLCRRLEPDTTPAGRRGCGAGGRSDLAGS